MSQENENALPIFELSKLKAVHFADLIRAAQLIYDPGKGVSGISREVNWREFGIPNEVAENLKYLGREYQYASPHIPVEDIWSKLTPLTRIWFLKTKRICGKSKNFSPLLTKIKLNWLIALARAKICYTSCSISNINYFYCSIKGKTIFFTFLFKFRCSSFFC